MQQSKHFRQWARYLSLVDQFIALCSSINVQKFNLPADRKSIASLLQD